MKQSTKNKITSTIFVTGLTLAAVYIINKLIFAMATAKERLNSGSGTFYQWRFGKVFYKKQGSGKPLLLIHQLDPTSSAYEWNKMTKELAKDHTVYTMDLIGCGRSDKPNFTYTNYLYVQLVSDFIKNVIGQKADVAATGLSGSFVVMACHAHPDLFDRIMIINPEDLTTQGQAPDTWSKAQKFLLELPLVGTLYYNACTSQCKIRETFYKHYFSDRDQCSTRNILAYHEAAHLGHANARYLMASMKGRFVNINISHALKKLDTPIALLGGSQVDDIRNTMADYMDLNPSIKRAMISDTRQLPQLEKPDAVLTQFRTYFD